MNYSELGPWIRDERKRQNLKQGELARMAGYTDNHLRRIEKGRDMPTLQTAENMLTVLGYQLEISIKKIGGQA